MLRLGGHRLLAPALRRTALCQSKSTALYHSEHAGGGHTRTGQGLAAEVLPGIATARTPERTAELEALAEKHNGFLFGELPLEEGQSRQWEDWEYSWTPLMCSAAALYFVAYYFRPYHSMDEWARARAIERMNALEAAASDEE